MTVSLVTLSSETELSFTGIHFPTEDCEAIFLGQVSNSCDVQSPTSVVATFEKGLPTTSTASTPELRFLASEGTHYALFDQAAVLSNPLDITSTTSGVTSSFAGG